MRALLVLTVANFRSFVRDRAALFWTFAFPLVFILLFGSIFSGGGGGSMTFGWVDEDATPRSQAVRAALAELDNVELEDGSREAILERMREGEMRAVLVVPAGFGATIDAASNAPGPPAAIEVYTDAAQQSQQGAVYQVVGTVLGRLNLEIAGRGPAIVPTPRSIQTRDLNAISYYVPSILGMALMQLGVFSAIPLVADREKLILKRLGATPLRRWQLVGSNVLMRLVVGIAQAIIIMAVGALVFDVDIGANLPLIAAFVVLGTLAFVALGYVIASFASTEDAANGMSSMAQFPLMFLSGTFFPLDAMPEFLQGIARVMPLTYLSDALRQVMVDATPFVPLWVCAAVLAGFLAVCFTIAARFFRWQ